MQMKKGMVFDLKRFAVHDGSGLRSTLFLKGCPLRCPWCQNPEGLSTAPLLWYAPSDCMHCGSCVEACPEQALQLGKDRLHMNRQICILCGQCAQACPAAALEIRGKIMTSADAAQALLRDRVFFADGGGVTLSGGECLLQWEFAAQVLGICHNCGVDTAIETSLYASRHVIDAMLPVTDHFLVDIKYLDGNVHKEVIGTDNAAILGNYEYLISKGADVIVRTPLIPSYTASDENIRAIAQYVKKKDPDARYELLNFNPLCRGKYAALESPYPVGETLPFTPAQMEHYYSILEEEGILHIIKE